LTKVDNAAFSHPHDLLVRSMLTDVDLAADLLRNYLDPKLTALLDLDRIVLELSVAVDKGLAETLSDLRYSLPFKGSGGRLRFSSSSSTVCRSKRRERWERAKGCLASRDRFAGTGHKPPYAAWVKSPGRERYGKRR
jgi:hypothetical protein